MPKRVRARYPERWGIAYIVSHDDVTYERPYSNALPSGGETMSKKNHVAIYSSHKETLIFFFHFRKTLLWALNIFLSANMSNKIISLTLEIKQVHPPRHSSSSSGGSTNWYNVEVGLNIHIKIKLTILNVSR